MIKIYNSIKFIGRLGIKRFTRELIFRVTNIYYERYFNVNTGSSVKLLDIGIVNTDSIDYEPMKYISIYSALKKVELDFTNSTLLDYGAGKGRAVIAASAMPFKKIIGVELSKDLAAIANQNIKQMRNKKTKFIELITTDASEFNIPNDVNIIYFYNPFKGTTLEKVFANIYSSYKQYPRKIYIIFFNNDHFEKIITNSDWLNKIFQENCPEYSYGIYCTLAKKTV